MTEETPDQTGAEQGSSDPGAPGSAAEDVPGSGSGEQPSQEELRARLEEQLRNLRVQDLIVESVVSVLNLTARRIAKEDERDLEQGRIGIEAIRAWVDLLPEEAANQIRQALSELQLLYAQAETQNVRRRLEKEKQDASAYAATGFARDILSVADNLARALASFPESLRDNVAISAP